MDDRMNLFVRKRRILQMETWCMRAILAETFLIPLWPEGATAALLVGVLFWLGRWRLDPEFHFRQLPFDVPIALFVILGGISVLSSPDWGFSFYNYYNLVGSYVLTYLLVGQNVRNRSQVKNMVLALGAGAMLVVFYGFYQYLFGIDTTDMKWVDGSVFPSLHGRVFSTLENPNILAGYLDAAICVALGIYAKTSGRPRRMFLGACMVLMVLCLAMTYARGCFLTIGLIFAWYGIRRDRRILVACLAVVALLLLWDPALYDRVASVFTKVDTSSEMRLAIWESTVAMIEDHPFFGIGWGAFWMVYPSYDFYLQGADVKLVHAHNMYLNYAAEIGIVGALSFFWYFFGTMRMAFGYRDEVLEERRAAEKAAEEERRLEEIRLLEQQRLEAEQRAAQEAEARKAQAMKEAEEARKAKEAQEAEKAKAAAEEKTGAEATEGKAEEPVETEPTKKAEAAAEETGAEEEAEMPEETEPVEEADTAEEETSVEEAEEEAEMPEETEPVEETDTAEEETGAEEAEGEAEEPEETEPVEEAETAEEETGAEEAKGEAEEPEETEPTEEAEAEEETGTEEAKGEAEEAEETEPTEEAEAEEETGTEEAKGEAEEPEETEPVEEAKAAEEETGAEEDAAAPEESAIGETAADESMDDGEKTEDSAADASEGHAPEAKDPEDIEGERANEVQNTPENTEKIQEKESVAEENENAEKNEGEIQESKDVTSEEKSIEDPMDADPEDASETDRVAPAKEGTEDAAASEKPEEPESTDGEKPAKQKPAKKSAMAAFFSSAEASERQEEDASKMESGEQDSMEERGDFLAEIMSWESRTFCEGLGLGIGFALVSVALNGLTDDLLFNIPSSMLLWLLAALAASLPELPREEADEGILFQGDGQEKGME